MCVRARCQIVSFEVLQFLYNDYKHNKLLLKILDFIWSDISFTKQTNKEILIPFFLSKDIL